MHPPTLVVHADWSSGPAKRWMARASRGADGVYRAGAPEPVGDLATFFDRLRGAAGDGGCVLLGGDFPIGLPLAHARKAGITSFPDALAEFGAGEWRRFYEVCSTPQEISLHRPFYPARPGGARQQHLLAGLGAASMDALRRQCERAYPGRRAAAPLFWTLGGQQVGKAAISGWRDLLGPALRSGRPGLLLWPFAGRLDRLCAPGHIVVAESYPAEFYGHLGVVLRSGGRGGGKRVQSVRKANGLVLSAWAAQAGVELDPLLAGQLQDGFGGAPDGEDRFDAVVGLFGMLNVVLGRQPPGEVRDGPLRAIEGWILGQAVSR